jgi:two-component system alkaline phosphatase synthesis response regulator PhoP
LPHDNSAHLSLAAGLLFETRYGGWKMDKKRILIVDDEPDLVETLQVRLAQENYECLTANDGHNGFELARTEKPDLVILDIMLPVMDGYKVARLLKFQKELKHIPIIMLSAKDRDEDRLMGEQTGANYYITKPFSMDKVVTTVKGFLAD